jgi:TAG lipase/lysophosphatidylethanolamine acyltransferase
MIYMLRSGFIRNLGGIGDKKLFDYLYSGTKNLIEMYLTEIELQLDIISQHSPHFNLISDLSQSFGSTALSLQGGATFGLMHLGVVKALCYHGLLPKIIIGNSIGSLIAALVCVHTDDELPVYPSNSAYI